ncbi:putative regulatory protein [Gottschalkia purinilytica]|uniref:Putative regulatory protein n=1 Tax=Gottschalkia purinilytica TaxID=1503 RepID=A0A0L0W6D2_GOTPU|nr:TrkA C-terminal domain-containing protein [Gottschalkia purinilytica]KNF07079.1 putative regulatory protein [Gottschalkia purinilytica]
MVIELSKYEKIALDIAYSIYNEELKEGEKVKGRSTLSGKYNVSPETIRRAIKLLSDMGVVEVSEKSGIYIKSKDKAGEYIKKYQSKNNVMTLKKNIEDLIKEKQDIDKKIMDNLNLLIEYSIHLKSIGSICPFQIELKAGSHLIGKSISEVQFWQQTGATIIGVHRGEEVMLSPGPDVKFEEGDSVLFIGNNKDIVNKVNEYVG